MVEKWSDLNPGATIYVLVGRRLDDGSLIGYELQKSEIINIHYYQFHCNIRFKYTDTEGKRKRYELPVSYQYDNDDYVCGFWKGSSLKDVQFIVTYKDPKCLKKVYKDTLSKQIVKCINTIETLQESLMVLREEKHSINKILNDLI